MSVVVVTTISCDAVILRCSSCQTEVAVTSETTVSNCRACNAAMLLDRSCDGGFALRRDGLLIRCIAENKDGWRCEARSGRDFCADHVHLADSPRVALPTLQLPQITF